MLSRRTLTGCIAISHAHIHLSNNPPKFVCYPDLTLHHTAPYSMTSSHTHTLHSKDRTFAIPIKVRIINVLKHWVDKHYQDFDTAPVRQTKKTPY